MLKLIHTRILLILLVFWLPVSHAADKFEYGLLWKIDDEVTEPSYLFGTMHSEDPRVTRLPWEVERALDNSRSLTLELLPDAQLLQAGMAMFFDDGRTLDKVAGRRLFDASVKAMAGYGIPKEMVQRMKPWAVFTTLSVPKPKTGIFLDMVLYQHAQKRGKQLHALETAGEQLSVFDDMPIADQLQLLEHTLNNYHTMDSQIEQLTRAYLDRDLVELQALGDDFVPVDDAAAERLMTSLVVDRNHRMLQRMQMQLSQGGAFIAVGALHLAGPDGLLQLLEEAGYNVSRVY
jgi:uncharacterized protein YbaP (TraB family)